MSAFEAPGGRDEFNRFQRDREAWGRPYEEPLSAHDEVTKRIVVGFGFWVYLLSDIVMFSAFLATYAVLVGATAGGPSGRDLFGLHKVAIETAAFSSRALLAAWRASARALAAGPGSMAR